MTSASDDPKPFPRLFNRLPIPRHRWGTILLAAWMAVGLMAGCGGGDEAEDGVDTTASEETEQADRERSADRAERSPRRAPVAREALGTRDARRSGPKPSRATRRRPSRGRRAATKRRGRERVSSRRNYPA